MNNRRLEPCDNVEHDVRLAPLTSLRVGGPARTLVTATSDDELVATVERCDDADEPVLLLGGGSNVVVADSGFAGTVVRVLTNGHIVEPDGDCIRVTAAAGAGWDHLVAQTVVDGWSGLEALSGIPGSVGATPIQNVGAYGHEVAEVVEAVHVFDRRKRRRRTLSPGQCRFGYRSSRFKSEPGRWVVLSVTFRLRRSELSAPVAYADLAARLDVARGERTSAIAVRRAVLALRRSKGMVLDIADPDTWSVGSFFTNPVVSAQQAAQIPVDSPRWPIADGRIKLSAAWLIEQSGFARGWPGPDSPARLSTKHTLAITNRGAATTADVLKLARSIRAGVRERFGVELVPEPNLIGCSL